MGTAYETIYKRFLLKIKDFIFFELCEETAENFCYGLMQSALAKAKNLEHDLSKMNDENKCFDEELSNMEVEYIAIGMTAEWVEPQLNNTTLTSFYIGSKDEKFYSTANQISQLRGLRDDCIARTKKIRRDYMYQNSEYFSS